MDVEFDNPDLDTLEVDDKAGRRYEPGVVKAYRKRMQHIRASLDERDLRSNPGYNFERLKGNRIDQYSMRLNDQWRLVLKMEDRGGRRVIVICGIEDYH